MTHTTSSQASDAGWNAFGKVRLRRPERNQHQYAAYCLDSQLEPDHAARTVWEFVHKQDLTALENRIRARQWRSGAAAADPRLLLALWLFATLNNIGSARELERLCEEHIAYRWLCGGVSVNYHTLSDFRGGLGSFLDDLLSRMITALVNAGLIDGKTITTDGTKVLASAGTSSFRRKQTLEELYTKAKAHVEKLKEEGQDPGATVRQRAARQRAAHDRLGRLKAALDVMPEIEALKRSNAGRARAQHPARVSTTDPDARRMAVANGGVRPAYNVLLTEDSKSRAITGFVLTQSSSDAGQSRAARLDTQARTGVQVQTVIADLGFVSKDVIEQEEQDGVACVMPLRKNKEGEPCTAHRRDGKGVKQWRARMQTPEAQALYKTRAGSAETPFGELKTYRTMSRVLVRGFKKVKGVVLLSLVVHQLFHFKEVLA